MRCCAVPVGRDAETVGALQDQHKSDLQALANLENRTVFAESHLEKLRAKFVKLLGERGVGVEGAGKRVAGAITTPTPVAAAVSSTRCDSKTSAPIVQQPAKVTTSPPHHRSR